MENNNQQSFWQFSDQLRLQASSLANLSLNDSIWSNNYTSKRPDQRRNFDVKGSGVVDINSFTNLNSKASDFNDGWKMTYSNGSLFSMTHNNTLGGLNGGFNKGIYSNTPSYVNLNNNNLNINPKGRKAGFKGEDGFQPPKSAKKNTNTNTNKKHGDNTNDITKDTKTAADKRFKTLPPSESLPRNETIEAISSFAIMIPWQRISNDSSLMSSMGDLNDFSILDTTEHLVSTPPVVFDTTGVLSPRPDGRRNRSEAWKHFSVESGLDKRARCNYCGILIKYDNGTSAMRTHLKRCKDNPDKDENKRQRSVSSSTATAEGHVVCSPLYAKFAKKPVGMNL